MVNNIERTAALYIVKNIFSMLLAIFSVILMLDYPLEPSQVSLISMFTIGIPGFLLSLMPNKNRIEGHFITNILTRALPAALTDFLMVATLVVFGQEFAVGSEDISLPDQQAAQLDALDDPDRLDYCLHFLQYLSEPAVRHF